MEINFTTDQSEIYLNDLTTHLTNYDPETQITEYTVIINQNKLREINGFILFRIKGYEFLKEKYPSIKLN